MQLDDLTHDEELALGGLLRLLLRSDAQFSEAEEATLERIGARIGGGAAALWKVISQSAQECPNDAAILAAARKVQRAPVRQLILGLLGEVAAADGTAQPELLLLQRVQQLRS